MSAEIKVLETGKTDKEIADGLRKEITEKLNEICPILDRANAAGLQVSFNLAMGPFGKQIVQTLLIVKPL